MTTPIISVIIVVYNAHTTIEASLKSVLSQSYEARELVIIDGASTDGTLDIIEKYKNKLGYFVSEKDAGIYDAMNKAIQAAKGDWLYFLGSDDMLFDNEVLSKIFELSEIEQADFIYGDVKLKSNNQLYGGSRTFASLIEKNINHQAIFYRKHIFGRVGNYNLKYKVLADYDLNLRIFENNSILKNYLPITVCLFNDKGGASNITIDSSFFADKLLQFSCNAGLAVSKATLQQYYFYTGFVLLMRDKNLEGLKYCLQAFTAGPRKIFYSLIFIKFLLGYLGLGKKIKIV